MAFVRLLPRSVCPVRAPDRRRAAPARDFRDELGSVADRAAHLTPMRAVMLAPLGLISVTVTHVSSFPYDRVLGFDVLVKATFLELPGYGSPPSPRLAPSCRWLRPSASSSLTNG